MTDWQLRPLDAVYPVIFIDAIVVKVRDGAKASLRSGFWDQGHEQAVLRRSPA